MDFNLSQTGQNRVRGREESDAHLTTKPNHSNDYNLRHTHTSDRNFTPNHRSSHVSFSNTMNQSWNEPFYPDGNSLWTPNSTPHVNNAYPPRGPHAGFQYDQFQAPPETYYDQNSVQGNHFNGSTLSAQTRPSPSHYHTPSSSHHENVRQDEDEPSANEFSSPSPPRFQAPPPSSRPTKMHAPSSTAKLSSSTPKIQAKMWSAPRATGEHSRQDHNQLLRSDSTPFELEAGLEYPDDDILLAQAASRNAVVTPRSPSTGTFGVWSCYFPDYASSYRYRNTPSWRPAPDPDIPKTNEEKLFYVKMVAGAITDVSKIQDRPNAKTQLIPRFTQGKYPQQDVEAGAWRVVEDTIRLHTYGAVAYVSPDASPSVLTDKNLGFVARIEAICTNLTCFKSLCQRCMGNDNIVNLIQGPERQLRRNLQNVSNNETKSARLKALSTSVYESMSKQEKQDLANRNTRKKRKNAKAAAAQQEPEDDDGDFLEPPTKKTRTSDQMVAYHSNVPARSQQRGPVTRHRTQQRQVVVGSSSSPGPFNVQALKAPVQRNNIYPGHPVAQNSGHYSRQLDGMSQGYPAVEEEERCHQEEEQRFPQEYQQEYNQDFLDDDGQPFNFNQKQDEDVVPDLKQVREYNNSTTDEATDNEAPTGLAEGHQQELPAEGFTSGTGEVPATLDGVDFQAPTDGVLDQYSFDELFDADWQPAEEQTE